MDIPPRRQTRARVLAEGRKRVDELFGQFLDQGWGVRNGGRTSISAALRVLLGAAAFALSIARANMASLILAAAPGSLNRLAGL